MSKHWFTAFTKWRTAFSRRLIWFPKRETAGVRQRLLARHMKLHVLHDFLPQAFPIMTKTFYIVRIWDWSETDGTVHKSQKYYRAAIYIWLYWVRRRQFIGVDHCEACEDSFEQICTFLSDGTALGTARGTSSAEDSHWTLACRNQCVETDAQPPGRSLWTATTRRIL